MRSISTPTSSFDDVLVAVQARVPGAAEAFIAQHGSWVARTSAALCRRFQVPAQEQEDIVQDTYCRLLNPSLGRFAPTRGSGKQYLRGVIMNAIDFEGRRRRSVCKEVSVEPEGDETRGEVLDVDWERPFDQLGARMDLSRLLQRTDVVVARAVSLLCTNGLSQRDAARAVGISEFRLSRALSRLSAAAA